MHNEDTVAQVDSRWWSEVSLEGKTIVVQLDTGATKSILPHHVYKNLKLDKPLLPTSCKLKSYTNHPLQVAGKVLLQTEYKGKVQNVEYQVVHVDQKPLLSGDACSQLGLIERVNMVDKYPELSKTTGMLPGTYKIRIDPSVEPVVHGPRRQPKALVDRIKRKLQ